MSHGLTLEQLDALLALQLGLAWAGETPEGGTPRLGWWRTDLVDAEGGGALWSRLLPRTHRWAGLAAARRAAMQVDAQRRLPNARADAMRTLFHFGFELDEALDERLAHHKLEAADPADVLPFLAHTRRPFDSQALLAALEAPAQDLDFKVTPGGRQLKALAAESPVDQARRLAHALLSEPARDYPLPFILDESGRVGR